MEAVADAKPIDLGPHKQRALLALLLLRANRVVTTDRILEDLWGDDSHGKENALWVYVSRLRSTLEPDRSERGQSSVLLTRDHGYVLAVDEGAIDSHRFESAVGQARALLRDDPVAAGQILRDALATWRGAALEDVAYESFAGPEIARLEELRLAALEDRIEADLRAGQASELIGDLEQLRRAEPLRERPVGQLMLALYRSGRHAEALRAFERFRFQLGDELGIEPSPELRRLEEQVLLHDDALLVRPRDNVVANNHERRAVGANPYKGLLPFRESDAADFFGRDRLLSDVVGRLVREDRLVALVGPSGSGKSSVVRAGLVPALRRGAVAGSDSWVIAQMVPGTQPFAEMEAALLRAAVDGPATLPNEIWDTDDGLLRAALRMLPEDGVLLLVVDQFEELFTLVDRPGVVRRFIANLLGALADPRGRIRVVLTLRADAYHRPLEHAELGARLSTAVLNVVPLLPDELETAAEGPARRAGVYLEGALLAELLTDVVGQPGALPIFQYALTELFDQRIDDRLTLASYRALGGVHGALRRRADEVFEQLDPAAQAATKQLFLRLVAVAEHDRWSRRRVFASELLSLDIDAVDLQGVIDVFGRHRFLAFDRDPVSGAPTVEVAHEALLTEWERLRQWIEAARADLRRHALLVSAMSEWAEAGRDVDYLLSGGRLAEYERWRAATELALTAPELDFLDASTRHREEQLRQQSSQVAESERLRRRSIRRLWALVAAVALLGALTIPQILAGDEEPPTVGLVGVGLSSIDRLVLASLDQAERELGVTVALVPDAVTDIGEEIRELARTSDLVIVLGRQSSFPALAVASEFPDVTWAFVETAPGMQAPGVSFSFAEEEGSYLAGVAAAETSTTGTVGFVGGWQSDQIERFRAGFEAGARSIDPGIAVLASYVSVGPQADGFGRDDLAAVVARSLYDQGADVVFHAAGAAGGGVIEAARAASTATGEQHWAIGVDADQYYEVDDTLRSYVLTSMVKRYDVVVTNLVEDFAAGRLEPGHRRLSVGDGSMRLTTSGDFMDDQTLEALGLAEAAIGEGRITVPTVPTGELQVPPGVTDPAVLTVIFDGQRCRYDGPSELTVGQTIRLDFRNETPEAAMLSLSLRPQRQGILDVLAQGGRDGSGYITIGGDAEAYALDCYAELADPTTAVAGSELTVLR